MPEAPRGTGRAAAGSASHVPALPAFVRLDPAVEDALASGRAVVALETAVVTHGLPRAPMDPSLAVTDLDGAEELRDCPLNLAASLLQARRVRGAGAVPAVIAVLDGRIHVGVAPAELERLAAHPSPRKLSARDLAAAVAGGATGGTTVAACTAVAAACGIRVFATGGIGGVHRGWHASLDISADLAAIARAPCCVVCAGPKSILDVEATAEALDSLGVPLLGWRTDGLPRFVCPPRDQPRVSARVDTAEQAVAICRAHWALGGGGALLVRPVDPAFALPEEVFERALRDAPTAASGAAVTPALLAAVAAGTGGRSIRANLEVLAGNAALAAELALADAADRPHGGSGRGP